MPSSRAAWPRLAGRWRSSFWRSSVERPGQRGEGEAVGNGNALVLAEGCDVELLPLDVDGIARIDGELLGDVRIEPADLGPDRCEPRDIDIGISQQLEGAPLASVAIDGEAVLGGFVRRERQAPQQSRALVQSLRLRGEGRAARGADAADVDAERRQALVGIVGTERQPVFGAAR